MPGSRIFCYYGHGNTGLLAFVSSDNGSTYLTGSLIPYCSGESTVESLAANALRNQTLTFYDACLAGRTMDSSSLVGMTYYRGSHYVVSFLNETTNDMSGFVVNGRNDNVTMINWLWV